MKPKNDISSSPIFCEHANEMPASCPCDDECYCKQHSCKPRVNPLRSVYHRTPERFGRAPGNVNVILPVPRGGRRRGRRIQDTERQPHGPSPIEEPCELYEEAIAKMREWLSFIYPPSKVDRALCINYIEVPDSITQKLYMMTKIWTFNNAYSITASIHVLNPTGYLGCGGQSRKPRTGESWNRGNDLADGKFTEETWQKIVLDIVRYEAEEVKSEKWKD